MAFNEVGQASDDGALLDASFAAVLSEAATNALRAWAEEGRRRLSLDKWLTSGYTEAQVALAYVQEPDRPARKVVLKACPPESGAAREPTVHRRAVSEAPGEFADRHLVEQPYETVRSHDGWWVMFQDIAGGDLNRFRPVSALLESQTLPSVCGAVVRSVLREWNVADQIVETSVDGFLASMLGRRIEPGASLLAWADHDAHLAASPCASLVFEGDETPLANPFSLVFDVQTTLDLRVRQVTGRAHGDLHPDNVLVDMLPMPNPDSFRLIDLSAYASDAPLARDPSHLLLSVVARLLSQLSTRQRRSLASYVVRGDEESSRAIPLSLTEAVSSITRAAEVWPRERGLGEEWSTQWLLSLVGNALVFVARSNVADDDREWFFHLGAIAATEYLMRENRWSPGEPHSYGDREQGEGTAQGAAEAIDDACALFTGSACAIAVVPEDALTDLGLRALSRVPWDLVLEFDPFTDESGGFAVARRGGGTHRLVTPDQEPIFVRQSTTWLAARGLADVRGGVPPADLRQWRRDALPGFVRACQTLSRQTSRPLTLVVLGRPDARARAIVEAALDVYGDRARVISVDSDELVHELAPYEVEHYRADVSAALARLPNRWSRSDGTATALTLPGSRGPVIVPADRVAVLEEIGELLHSRVASAMPDTDSTGFFRGRRISFLELDLGVDIPRPLTASLVERLRHDLHDRGTFRVALGHAPGAGGSTVARRAAWELHGDFPTLLVRQVVDAHDLADRIRQLFQLTDLPVLVVLELTSDRVVSAVFDALRADSISAVLLIVGRRMDPPTHPTTRTPYLGLLDEDERSEFARRFSVLAPARAAELRALARHTGRDAVPFFFGLTAFDAAFTGVEDYVSQFLESVDDDERVVLILTALAHRYAGVAAPADLFAGVLRVPMSDPVRFTDRLGDGARGLLIQETYGYWRTLHPVIAEEILRQLLMPEASTTRDAWTTSLTTWSLTLIEEAASVFGSEVPPDDVVGLLSGLFLLRDNQDALGGGQAALAPRRSFSELMSVIPSAEGRVEVLRRLAETFPLEPHFWAHYGRMLSYDLQDHPAAHQALERALALEDGDSALFHMHGMVYRNQIRSLIRQFERAPDEEIRRDAEREVLRLCDLALGLFERARTIDNASEYPLVATAQLCVMAIEFGYKNSGTATHAAFLVDPLAQHYSDLLLRAEDAMADLREILAGDQGSRYAAEVAADLRLIYDDFSGLLQGWRNMLDRSDVVPARVRRRIVGAYRERAGGWSSADPTVIAQVISLLDDNLRDDPRDGRSVLEWLRVARFAQASVDRAAELVSYWVEAEPTRDALYYDCVLALLLALEGRESSLREYRRKLDRSRERAVSFPHRRYVYEWLGRRSGLGQLVTHLDLRSWERRRADAPDPPNLRRIEGRVSEIRRAAAGQIEFGPGLYAFFAPAASGLVADRHVNERVTFLLGFAYEGPQAWSVRLVSPDPTAAALSPRPQSTE